MENTYEIIEIYPSKAESVKGVLYGCVFAAAGWWMIRFMPGYLAMILGSVSILFALAGFFVIAWQHIRSARRKPAAMIYDDRVAAFKPLQGRYDVVMFDEVNSFSISAISAAKFISAEYYDGTVESLNISNSLVDNIEQICDILNDRLNQYRLDKPEYQNESGEAF